MNMVTNSYNQRRDNRNQPVCKGQIKLSKHRNPNLQPKKSNRHLLHLPRWTYQIWVHRHSQQPLPPLNSKLHRTSQRSNNLHSISCKVAQTQHLHHSNKRLIFLTWAQVPALLNRLQQQHNNQRLQTSLISSEMHLLLNNSNQVLHPLQCLPDSISTSPKLLQPHSPLNIQLQFNLDSISCQDQVNQINRPLLQHLTHSHNNNHSSLMRSKRKPNKRDTFPRTKMQTMLGSKEPNSQTLSILEQNPLKISQNLPPFTSSQMSIRRASRLFRVISNQWLILMVSGVCDFHLI